MHYLIFIPNKSAANKQHLIDAGLGDLLREGDESPVCTDLIGRGPGDLPGQIWSWGNAKPFYLPDEQTWTQCGEGYWVGVSTAAPPVPDDLIRKNAIGGRALPLADGKEWLIPNVVDLPMTFGLGSDFKPQRVPQKQYKLFAEDCVWALNAVIDTLKNDSIPEWEKALAFAAQALSLNYRVNLTIALHFGIINDPLLFDLMVVATDRDQIRDILADVKKKGAASESNG